MKKKSVLLIGLGKFGTQIAEELYKLGHDVMVVDRLEERVNDAMKYASNGQIGNSTNVDFLKSLGINDYDFCIVSIGGDFQSSLETTCLLKELGAKTVISRAESDGQAKFLLRNGADEVVYPEKQLAAWMAMKYSSESIIDYIEVDENCSILEVIIPKDWLGKSIRQIDIRNKYGVNIVALKQNGKAITDFSPDVILSSDYTILVIGTYKSIQKAFSIK